MALYFAMMLRLPVLGVSIILLLMPQYSCSLDVALNRGIRSHVLTHTWGGSVITQKLAECLDPEHVNSRAILELTTN